ncbi:cytochrome P450 [Halobacillus salinarum]|uniref:Cytochrome P450 n=1 Tax=Halobacillus salinarum TaxID=2932257 RepID=A0ABY4EPT8_9BACI|nr:cytochrome P450 [Halobacillus salinarum]UOQ44111.1 cytochrome P450 [Halobacillus salinarum]
MVVKVPKDKGIDRTYAIFKDGYQFIQKRVQNHHLDVYETKILGSKTALLSGEEGAKLFYDNERMQRNSAMPPRVLKTLFGEDGVQTLDGDVHRRRKNVFMTLMTPESLKLLHEITLHHWEQALLKWQSEKKVVLFEEMLVLLTKTACEWAGVPLESKETKKRAKDFNKLIEGAAKLGPDHFASRRARKRLEDWAAALIEKCRKGELDSKEGSALHEMAVHRDTHGELLDAHTASVELLNVLRPMVAISRFIVFGASAMRENPEIRKRISNDEHYLRAFTQEVRRYFPFFPFLGAIAVKDFTWQQYPFKKGQLVLLDLYGTNHDPRLYENPEQFTPERFHKQKGGMFDLIPQGGGDYHQGHRCPGEWPTIEVLKASFSFMAEELDFDLPKQDLHYSLREIPSLPKSGFIMKNVRRRVPS